MGITGAGWAAGGLLAGCRPASRRVGEASAVTQPGGPGRAAQPVGPARDANEPPGPSRGRAAQGVTGREAGRALRARGGKWARRGLCWALGGCGPVWEWGRPAARSVCSPIEDAAERPLWSRDVSAPG